MNPRTISFRAAFYLVALALASPRAFSEALDLERLHEIGVTMIEDSSVVEVAFMAVGEPKFVLR
ncbi:hypothetical protein Poly59_54260 [Rubripirellula reticaptiva]|uniref:Uncharacterized protein n=1 Tax=Rubripirellula reticaptiva TaxID=2528013 RepID=A0A5C6E9U7_9BACT|nr:hypothetical protein Poly59_54260 [Rubripirellula reticaptiva]